MTDDAEEIRQKVRLLSSEFIHTIYHEKELAQFFSDTPENGECVGYLRPCWQTGLLSLAGLGPHGRKSVANECWPMMQNLIEDGSLQPILSLLLWCAEIPKEVAADEQVIPCSPLSQKGQRSLVFVKVSHEGGLPTAGFATDPVHLHC